MSESDEIDDEPLVIDETPVELLMNAIMGLMGHETMMLKGVVRGKKVVVLVDSGHPTILF